MKTSPVCQCLYIGITGELPYFKQHGEKPSPAFTFCSSLKYHPLVEPK
jgi:hypothetical protein